MKKGIVLIGLILLINIGFILAQTCTDSDGGINPYVKGKVIWNFSNGSPQQDILEDFCTNQGESLWEEYCYNSSPDGKTIECLVGCEDGACIKIDPNKNNKPISLTHRGEPFFEEINYSEICLGCVEMVYYSQHEASIECFPYGYVLNHYYCDFNGEIKKQVQTDSKCNNNFECNSNLCVSNICKNRGLLQKIINFFNGLFIRK